jgi:hypothetical protein
MSAKTQTLEGVTSLQPDGSHIVMWDFKKLYVTSSRRNLAENSTKITASRALTDRHYSRARNWESVRVVVFVSVSVYVNVYVNVRVFEREKD